MLTKFYANTETWVKYDIGTVEKLTFTAADRRINVPFMKISYSQGARN